MKRKLDMCLCLSSSFNFFSLGVAGREMMCIILDCKGRFAGSSAGLCYWHWICGWLFVFSWGSVLVECEGAVVMDS